MPVGVIDRRADPGGVDASVGDVAATSKTKAATLKQAIADHPVHLIGTAVRRWPAHLALSGWRGVDEPGWPRPGPADDEGAAAMSFDRRGASPACRAGLCCRVRHLRGDPRMAEQVRSRGYPFCFAGGADRGTRKDAMVKTTNMRPQDRQGR